MNIVLFEDLHVNRLYPVTIGKAAYAITCASFRLVDWMYRLALPTQSLVRKHLVDIQELDYPELNKQKMDGESACVMLNSRLVPSLSNFQRIQQVLEETQEGVVLYEGEVAAVVLPAGTTQPPASLEAEDVEEFFRYIGLNSFRKIDIPLALFQYPHDIVRENLEAISENLDFRLKHREYQEVRDGVFLAEGATLGDYVVTDTSDGPILLEKNAQIGPHCYLSGPAWLGEKARVIEHSAIKDAVSISHTTKIGGEVEASVIEPYTNKQHYGFLGHSYLGSWINLGAGTCNSDLKNTYGDVKMEYGRHKVPSGMQFVGCIMGDYAKSAINTGIFTGKTIGACSMVYGFVTTNVPSFVNYARHFGQVTELPPEVMVSTQKRMFQRRDVSQRPCDRELLHDMYQLTVEERQLADEPLSL